MLVLALCAGVALLDQATKYLVWARIAPGARIPIVDGFFDLTYVGNTGAAWGILPQRNGMLALLSLVVFVCLIVFRRHLLRDTLAHTLALGLMLGGILGNAIDRLRVSHVIDFLDFHWAGRHFPSFNVADSAICVGVGLYLLAEHLWVRAEAARGVAGPGDG